MVGKYVLLSLMLQQCYCAYLTLHNLEKSLVTENENLLLDLEFDHGDDVDIWDIEESYPCILINGSTCKCLRDTLEFADFKSDIKDCLAHHNLDSPAWISVQLRMSPDAGEAFITSLPVKVEGKDAPMPEGITLVLPLTRNDVQRSYVLFQSLSSINDATVVYEMLVFAPDSHVKFISQQLLPYDLPFAISVHPESALFKTPEVLKSSFPYSIQMAVKLLASKFVQSDFYMTLDADVILLRSFSIEDVLSRPKNSKDHTSNNGVGNQALYHKESRLVHPAWWHGSATFLDICRNLSGADLDDAVLLPPGFGVTPALLSTYGSLLAVSFIEELAAKSSARQEHNNPPDHEAFWLQVFGVDGQVWSEYTIYRIVLDLHGIFRKLHVPEFYRFHLHCHDVWFAEKLPWNRTSAELSNSCLFSVVQSSTGADVESLLVS